MLKAVQTWQTVVPQGQEGRQCQTKPGPVPGGLARTRPEGGSGQEHESSRQSLGHQWGALGGSSRERTAEGSRLAMARLRLHVEHVGRALVVPVPEAHIAWAL